VEEDDDEEIIFGSGEIGENTWTVEPKEPDTNQTTFSYTIYGVVGVLVLAIVTCFAYSVCCKRKKVPASEVQDSDDGEQPAV
jgi:hypothetical protein